MSKNEVIIKQITEIRTKNNIAWMGILALAINKAPREARRLMTQITKNDMAVSKLSARLGAGGRKK
jgi:hypothetical protein